jgi:DNA segregation ATPase FtsK/SpoIIIE, S-DNA-T family
MFGFKKRRNYRKRSALDYIAIPRIPSLDLDPETKKGIFIVIILALGAISFLGLLDLAGAMGRYLKDWLGLGFGWGKWLVPIILISLGYVIYDEEREIRARHYLGLVIFIFSFQGLLMLLVNSALWPEALEAGSGGGYIGWLLASSLINASGFWASLILDLSLFIISILMMFNTKLARLFGKESILGKIMTPISFFMSKISAWRKNRQEKKEEEPEEEENEDENEDESDDKEEKKEEDEENDEDENEDEEENDEENDDDDEEKKPAFKTAAIKEEAAAGFWWQEQTNIKINLPLNLLDDRREKPTSGDIKENQEIIKKTLEDFGIIVEMGEVTVGPTVTRYTLKPAEGIKVARITTLSNDLALALAAHPIRIEAPIPGKRLVGVEVPNQAKAKVSLKEILTSKNYYNRKVNSLIALGKDVAGTVFLDDITKMPHLLVAGATNSGKSVCLNSIIVSLMYQNNPDELRFIMVDPKRVEMQSYNNIPYLLTPVITDAKNTIVALKWCMLEMERRFEVLSQSGHKNIQSYNESVKIKMPYIVFVIDELADLMSVAAKEVEAGVNRLAALARAVGIHLILATQRPSVDIITGVIKSNMPARIAFSVASGTDSRTIIDTMGAEKLLGRGDMLYINAEMSKPTRLQGAFLSDDEIRRVVRYVKDKGGASNYVTEVTDKLKSNDSSSFSFGDDNDDEFLAEAKEIVINQGKASASFLQRKFSIGYNRAARLIDILEKNGVVGPANGSKPREILVSREQYEATISTGVSGVSLHSREESEAPDEFLNSLGEEADLPPVLSSKKIDNGIDWDEESSAETTEDEETAEEEEIEEESDEETPDEAEEKPDENKKVKKPSTEVDDEDDGKYFSR